MCALKGVTFATLVITGFAVTAAPGFAQAQQNFPSKPIRIIVPFSAGSQTDLLARMIGPRMSEAWGQQVVVDNRPSSGGIAAGKIVVSAAPDGHTLLINSIAFAVSAALYSKLPYDPLKEFATVSRVASVPNVLVVAPSLGVKSVKDLIALAKEKPGQINFGSAGIGSGTHMNGEQFKFAAGINAVHVPYRGTPEALTDTMTGRVQYFFSPPMPALPLIKDGRLLGLAVSTAQRSPALPDIPTIAEAALPGFEHDAWFGIFAPAGTPQLVIRKLNQELERILNLPEIKEPMLMQAVQPRSSTPEEFAWMVHAEVEKFKIVVKAAGIKPE